MSTTTYCFMARNRKLSVFFLLKSAYLELSLSPLSGYKNNFDSWSQYFIVMFDDSVIFPALSCKYGGLFVCTEVTQPSQPNGAMSSAVSLPNHTFTGQA